MRVIWSSRAERELTLLVEYGMAVFGRTAAMRLYRQIKVTVTKLTVHPYLGKKRGLKKTAEIMQSNFKFHHHDRDEALGISPHTLKYTKYQGKYYLMGLCGVEIR